MACHRIKVGRHYGFVCVAGEYKAGDPCPSGYIDRYEWARVQMKAGIKQLYCRDCGKLFWDHPNLRKCKCGVPKVGVKSRKQIRKRSE